MVTIEQAFAFTHHLLKDLPEEQEKLEFLKKHTDDGLYWELLRCFLVGFEYKAVSEFVDKSMPENKEDVSTWMLEELTARLQDKDKLYQEISSLKKDMESVQRIRDEYERSLQEIQKYKMENKNMSQTVSQKDALIKQLQEKVKQQTKKSSEQLAGTSRCDSGGHLFLEAFKQEVLLNKDFSAEQKDYLFSLLEKGEKYSHIRMIASPDIDISDMKRFYNLTSKEEKKSFLDKIRDILPEAK